MPYSKASFINHSRELKQGKTIIEAQPMPLFYESGGLSRSTAEVLSRQEQLMEREMESQMDGGKPLSQKEQDEIDLLREIRKNYQKHLTAKVTVDADISPVVRGRNDAIKQAEKDVGIEYPYHFVWLDGAENETGIIEFPWDGYSKVYAVQGDYESPEIIFLEEVRAGDRTPKKPYYECVSGKTLVYVDGFSGAGTEQSPFEVADYSDLCKVGTGTGGWGLDSYYLQTANIQCPTSPKHNFLPIGNSDNPFTGQYDGNNKTIKDLYISRATTNYIGLFGYVDNGVLVNIGAEDVDVTGYRRMGGLVGDIEGVNSLIDSCYTTGEVKSPNTVTDTTSKAVGGVLGSANIDTIVKNSYSTATVTITGPRAGGFAGQLWTDCSAENCHATGKVTGDSYIGGFAGMMSAGIAIDCHATGDVESSGERAGGFVGQMQTSSSAEDCYATGGVTGGQYTGGFVGYTTASSAENCHATGEVTGGPRIGGFAGHLLSHATNCYATGDITGGSYNYVGGFMGSVGSGSRATNCYTISAVEGEGNYVGGFVGYSGGFPINNSFWDTDTSGQSTSGSGTVYAIGKTTAQMQSILTYSAWDICKIEDFDVDDPTIWFIDDGNDYPRLWFEYEAAEEPVPAPILQATQVNGKIRLTWGVE